MTKRYRIVTHYTGTEPDMFHVDWEGTFDELIARYGRSAKANPIKWSTSYMSLAFETVIEEQTRNGWKRYEDPRIR